MSSTYSTGPQGGLSLKVSRYRRYNSINVLTEAALNTHDPQQFTRVIGQQTLIVKNLSSGYTWSIPLRGGSNNLTSGVLPMAPNVTKGYDPVYDYVLDTGFPENCLVQYLPIPSNTLRINVFRITTLPVDGSLKYILSYSPFTGVQPTIQLEDVLQSVDGDIEIRTEYARTVWSSSGYAIPYATSFMTPTYRKRNYVTYFNAISGSSPLDDNLKHKFVRIIGLQQITFINRTNDGFAWTFTIDGGNNAISNGYIGSYDPSSVYISPPPSDPVQPRNCFVVTTQSPSMLGRAEFAQAQTTTLRIMTTDGLGNPISFLMTFSSMIDVKPTIQLEEPNVLGNVDCELIVTTYQFLYA
jgi:hypothetical protein